jgi:hypothetical protein
MGIKSPAIIRKNQILDKTDCGFYHLCITGPGLCTSITAMTDCKVAREVSQVFKLKGPCMDTRIF